MKNKFKIGPVITNDGLEYCIYRKRLFGWKIIRSCLIRLSGLFTSHDEIYFKSIQDAKNYIVEQYGKSAIIVPNYIGA